jgi:hypothetical protein
LGFFGCKDTGFLRGECGHPRFAKEKHRVRFHVELHPMSSRAFARVRIYCLGLDVVEHAISVGDLAKHTARITDGNGASRYVACDDATSSDHGALADGDATEDRH